MNKILRLSMLCLSSLFLINCESNLSEISEDNVNVNKSFKTRSTSSYWDSCTNGVLPSNSTVVLPWADGASTTIPDEIRKDIKQEDGWIIIDTTIRIEGYTTNITSADSGVNYLLLYNKTTGMLKGFYYAESMENNNCGAWQLTTSSPTKLFNFSSDFAVPIDGTSPQSITLTNVTSNGQTKGFETGWNCFMTELAYDANSDIQRLNISGYALNAATITLNGIYKSDSSGSIITSATQNKSGIITGLISGLGEGGKNWIAAQLGQTATNALKFPISIIPSVLSTGISGLISTGIYKVFGSVLGSSTNNYSLKFSTNGTVSIQGTLVNASSGMIRPISGLKLGSDSLDLGIWNLTTKPIYYTQAYGTLISSSPNSGGTDFKYKLERTLSNVQIQVNPAYSGHYQPTVSVVNYPSYKGSTYNTLFKGDSVIYTNHIYKEVNETTLYSDGSTIITTCTPIFNAYMYNLWPNVKTTDNKPAVRVDDCQFDVRDNTTVKILINIYNTIGNKNFTTYSSKSFIPKQAFNNSSARPYYWSKSELSSLGFPN